MNKNNQSTAEVSDDNAEVVAQSQVKRKKSSRRFSPKFLLGVVAVLLIAAGSYYFHYNSDGAKQAREEAETQEMLESLSKLILLPDETPVIYQIDDPQLLMNEQPFFAGAESGDSLLIFAETAKAVIYSPERDMIVNVGPITFDPGATGGAQ